MDKDNLEWLADKFDELWQNWFDCVECQYNEYICKIHIDREWFDFLREYGERMHEVDWNADLD